MSNYIVQPEDSGVGVFAHEYGHDLGLPDLYDTASGGESDVDFWDLMSSGSHSGPIFQSMPTHMGLWDKWVLGWADPKDVRSRRLGDADVKLGQTSRTPVGTEDGIESCTCRTRRSQLGEPHSGAHMWWSGNDQDWADNSITREIRCRPRRQARRAVLDVERLRASRRTGTTASSRCPPTAARPGTSRWSAPREQRRRSAPRTTIRTRTGGWLDFGGKKYGLTGEHERLAARLRRPHRLRRQDRAAAAALRHRRSVPGASAGSPTTSR